MEARMEVQEVGHDTIESLRASADQRGALITRHAQEPSDERLDRELGPEDHLFRQVLGTMFRIPDMHEYLKFSTAGMIVTVFSAWMTRRVVESRAFATFTSRFIIALGAAIAGTLIGALLGYAVIPPEFIPVMVVAFVVILLLILGMLVGALGERGDASAITTAATGIGLAVPRVRPRTRVLRGRRNGHAPYAITSYRTRSSDREQSL